MGQFNERLYYKYYIVALQALYPTCLCVCGHHWVAGLDTVLGSQAHHQVEAQ